uniref:Uncharacterized protein n=1 Tax=Globodera rostochiensis TaxID=31243 RepID=A0A914H589_GLORO
MTALPDDDLPPILDGPFSPARNGGPAETNYSDGVKPFRLADCLQILERVARDYDCIYPLPKLGSANRLYVFEWQECIELKGHLEMEDGSSKRVLHEFYEKYDSLEGFNRFLRKCLFNFFYLLYSAVED